MNSDTDAIIEEIVRALGPNLTPGVVITPETNITRDLGLDSLAVMNFVMVLEDKFDVSIPLDKIAEVETVGDLARTINELRGGN
ncbi:acyl carrier protein [Rhodospirillum centenum]|uniref:Conserved domain protein n=1 Tax=Rhodospirillum centenum (strain ATCC 51521 / SW) TaxID=414684 RepID=B6IRU2_RHOCS|nr:acyl carrier protein [Rhodospirillum centenum]ACI98178.1 conserved domain protein [Rhodospirillum centenum SW]